MTQNLLHPQFEEVLAYHCAPTLSNIKSANLICVNKKRFPDLSGIVTNYNELLTKSGLSFHMICECQGRMLILFYNRQTLINYLHQPEIQAYLASLGYNTESFDLNQYLDRLTLRLKGYHFEGQAFPHEVGIFLNYPLSDVLGFIENDGQNFQVCGYWKVYDNAAFAQKLFTKYDELRSQWTLVLRNGHKLHDVVNNPSAYNIA